MSIENLGKEIAELCAENERLKRALGTHYCPHNAQVARNYMHQNSISGKLLNWVLDNYPEVYEEMLDWAEQNQDIKRLEREIEPTGEEMKPLSKKVNTNA